METRRIIAGMITGAVCISVLAGCSSETGTQSSTKEQESKTSAAEQSTPAEQPSTDETSQKEDPQPETSEYTLTVKDTGKNPEITATFFNSSTGDTLDVKMEKTEERDDSYIYTCKGDTDKYNLVHFTVGDIVTKDGAFNKYLSAWHIFEGELVPCNISRDKEFELKYETKTFNVNGMDRKVYIWTPDDYDAASAEKYSTIYMLDGQNALTTELGTAMRSWNTAHHVDSMMSVTDNKAILVCLDAGKMRASDYSPVLGKDAVCQSSQTPAGDEFAKFVSKTVKPYIEENYNVYTDASHTSVAGSSMGGLESFYIAVENPDVFGTAGVFSPSFWAYDEKDWKAYFDTKTFDENSPFLYFYSGSYGQDTGYCAEPLYNGLLEIGYPKDKLVFSKNEKAEHNEEYWNDIYPEFLEAMFSGKVSALESGAPAKYIDRTPPQDTDLVMDAENNDEPDERPDYIKNYIFFDNSEMKWDKVCAYWFGLTKETPVNKATGEDNYGNPMWPGIEMEKMEGTDLYRVAAPLGVSAIIFSNGILDKDVKDGALAYQTVDLIYSDKAFSGRIYTIDASKEPSRGTGYEKTKYKYPSGTWREPAEGEIKE